MDIKQAIAEHLDLILTDPEIHYTTSPKNTPAPYCVITLISEPHDDSHEGEDGAIESRVQIDWFADTDTEAVNLAKETHTAMLQLQGGALNIARVKLDDKYDNYETDTSLFHRGLDYLIQFEERE